MESDTSKPPVGHRMASGAVFLLFARIVTKSLDVAMLLVLTRFLLPGDFGLVAIALSVVRITEAIFELPVGVALLQVSKLTRSHLDTALTVGLLRGTVVATILCLASVPLADFYGDDRLVALTCALALAPLMRGLCSPRLYEQFKALQFGPDALSEIIGKVAAVIAAASLAVVTESYWAIAVGAIAAPSVHAAASYVISPFRPALSLRHHRMFHRFVGWSMSAQTMSALNWQGDRFVLGKTVSQSELGGFSVSRDLAATAFKLISEIVFRSALAGLAQVRDDRTRLARTYAMTSSTLLAIGIPISVGQAAVAWELIAVLLGAQWMQSVPIFQAVSLALIPAFYASLTSSLFYAIDRPELVFSRNFVDFLFRIPAIVVMILLFGLAGAVAALIAADLFLASICMRSVSHLVGISIARQMLAGWRSLCSAAVMVVFIALVRWLAPHSGGTASAAVFLLAAIPTAAISYCAAHLFFWYLSGRPESVESHALEFAGRSLARLVRRCRAIRPRIYSAFRE